MEVYLEKENEEEGYVSDFLGVLLAIIQPSISFKILATILGKSMLSGRAKSRTGD